MCHTAQDFDVMCAEASVASDTYLLLRNATRGAAHDSESLFSDASELTVRVSSTSAAAR